MILLHYEFCSTGHSRGMCSLVSYPKLQCFLIVCRSGYETAFCLSGIVAHIA